MRQNYAPLLIPIVLVAIAVSAVPLALNWFAIPGFNARRAPAPAPNDSEEIEVDKPLPPLPPALTIEVPETKLADWPGGRPMVVLGDRRLLHGEEVEALAFRPDGKSLYSASREIVIEWDVASGKELARRLPNESDYFKFSLVAAQAGRIAEVEPSPRALKVTMFDWASQKQLWTDALRPTPDGDHHATVLSADGRYLAYLVANTVSLWDLDRRAEARVLTDGGREFTAAAFTPDGKSLVVGDAGHTIRVWTLAGDAPPRVFAAGAGNGVGEFAISPDGAKLASVGRQLHGERLSDRITRMPLFDPEVHIWDMAAGTLIGTVQAYSKEWVKMRSLPQHTKLLFLDNKALLTATAYPNFVHRWDATTATPLPDFPARLDRFVAFAVTADGKTLAAAATRTGRVCLFDVATGKEKLPVEAHDANIDSVAFSADGKTVLTGAADGARAWDATTGRPTARYPLDDPRLGEVNISANGRSIVTSSYSRSRVAVWDVGTGGLVRDLGGIGGSMAISTDGTIVAAHLHDGEGPRIGVWEVATGDRKWAADLPGDFHEDTLIYGPAMSADGRRLFAGRGGLAVFDIQAGRELARWDPKETGAVPADAGHFASFSIAPTPDGKELAFASEDTDEVVIVDALTGKPRLRIPTKSPVPLVYSVDGRTLGTGGGWRGKSVRLWNAQTGEMLRELSGKPTRASVLAFSPDGKRIAAGCYDGAGLVWNLSAK
jgi:WD40 repeat protein